LTVYFYIDIHVLLTKFLWTIVPCLNQYNTKFRDTKWINFEHCYWRL